MNAIDLVGQVFGRLQALTRAEDRAGRPATRCWCACSKQTVVDGRSLRAGRAQSCAAVESPDSWERIVGTSGLSSVLSNSAPRWFAGVDQLGEGARARARAPAVRDG